MNVSSPSELSLPLDAQQLHFEDERGSSGDLRRSSTVSVAQLSGDDQLPLLALTHAQQALVPAFNHLSGPQREGEGSVPGDAAVKLGAVLQLAGVVHVQHVPLPGLDRTVVHALLDADLELLLAAVSAHRRRAQRHNRHRRQQQEPHDFRRNVEFNELKRFTVQKEMELEKR